MNNKHFVSLNSWSNFSIDLKHLQLNSQITIEYANNIKNYIIFQKITNHHYLCSNTCILTPQGYKSFKILSRKEHSCKILVDDVVIRMCTLNTLTIIKTMINQLKIHHLQHYLLPYVIKNNMVITPYIEHDNNFKYLHLLWFFIESILNHCNIGDMRDDNIFINNDTPYIIDLDYNLQEKNPYIQIAHYLKLCLYYYHIKDISCFLTNKIIKYICNKDI